MASGLDHTAVPSDGPRRRRNRVLDAVSLIVVLLAFSVLASVAFQRLSYFRYAVLFAIGQNQNCSFHRAVHWLDEAQDRFEIFNRITAASRVVETEDDGFTLWETPRGKFWVPQTGEDHSPHWLFAEQESGIYGSGDAGVQPGDVVLDCGAHVGTFTRAALEAGAKLVVAIDPSPPVLEALRRNVAEGVAEGRVLIVEKGVWDREDTLPFIMTPDNHGTHHLSLEASDEQSVINVPLTTIDNLVAELNLDRVDFIKMDIEGAEQKALMGAQDTLAKYKPRLAIAAYHSPDDQTRIPAIVRAARTDYEMGCGGCGERDLAIFALTLLFQ